MLIGRAPSKSTTQSAALLTRNVANFSAAQSLDLISHAFLGLNVLFFMVDRGQQVARLGGIGIERSRHIQGCRCGVNVTKLILEHSEKVPVLAVPPQARQSGKTFGGLGQ